MAQKTPDREQSERASSVPPNQDDELEMADDEEFEDDELDSEDEVGDDEDVDEA